MCCRARRGRQLQSPNKQLLSMQDSKCSQAGKMYKHRRKSLQKVGECRSWGAGTEEEESMHSPDKQLQSIAKSAASLQPAGSTLVCSNELSFTRGSVISMSCRNRRARQHAEPTQAVACWPSQGG